MLMLLLLQLLVLVLVLVLVLPLLVLPLVVLLLLLLLLVMQYLLSLLVVSVLLPVKLLLPLLSTHHRPSTFELLGPGRSRRWGSGETTPPPIPSPATPGLGPASRTPKSLQRCHHHVLPFPSLSRPRLSLLLRGIYSRLSRAPH